MNEVPDTYFKDLMENVEKEFTAEYDNYMKLHKDLVPYANRLLNDEEIVIANDILKNIQFKFAEIFPVINFIGRRNDFANNVVNEYTKFLDDLKRLGGTEKQAVKP